MTGHTGFKGAWLCAWLSNLGAEVTGYALAPSTAPNMFDSIGIADRITSIIDDVRNSERLGQALDAVAPEIVFHLAAQSLVRESYLDPIETFEVNVQGTANLLEACRRQRGLRSIVVVTSDKCYRNDSKPHFFGEDDPLGGHDPYSASKACAEIVTSAFRDSFYTKADGGELGAAVSSARAGNVIGGGDWAKDRIVPDLVRAVVAGRPAVIRHPQAVRPWQHVLDPLAGYLMLGQAGWSDSKTYSGGFNFGPEPKSAATVKSIVDGFANLWGDRLRWEQQADASAPYEASMLVLDASKARQVLGWQPQLDFAQAIETTASWYDAYLNRQNLAAFTEKQIGAYVAAAELSSDLPQP